jgi:hypothetical protein
MTGADGVDGADTPLCPTPTTRTVNVYGTPLVSPVTVQVGSTVTQFRPPDAVTT